MDTLTIYDCGGDTVIIVGGVSAENIAQSSAEIIKGAPLSVQAGFVRSTEIAIPRCECAGDFFSADCALCFGKYLSEKIEESGSFQLSASGIASPMNATIEVENDLGCLALAGKAQSDYTGTLPQIVFGGCTYYIAAPEHAENAEELLRQCAETSPCESTVLLVLQDESVTPHFAQKGECTTAFSAGSAAIALAFYESETARDFFEKTYRFPKGERRVEMKRYLSRAFDCTLTASVKDK